MSLVDLAEAAGFTLPVLTLVWTAALGFVLHAALPPLSEDVADAVLAACFAA